VHIGILFSGLVHARELSFLRASPDSIFYAEFHCDPALRNGRPAGQRFNTIAEEEGGRSLSARAR
jgi:hypothetical protein